jgi:hypothetical protein
LLNNAAVPKSDRRHVDNNVSKEINCEAKINTMGVISSNAANRPFVPLKVQSIEGKWLYDTGASVTCMSLKHFRQIHPDKRPPKLQSQLKLNSAAKTVLKVTVLFMLKFKIFDKSFSHPVHVCETMNQQGIIGMDIIKRLGLTYLTNSKSF